MTALAGEVVAGVDPRTGDRLRTVATATSADDVDAIVSRVASTGAQLQGARRHGHALQLKQMAGVHTRKREQVVESADRETGLALPVSGQRFTRTTYQLQLFADMLREDSYVEAVIDHAAQPLMGRERTRGAS